MHKDTLEIPLTQGQVAIVDAADYEWLSQYKWFAQRHPTSGFYAARKSPRIDGKQSMIMMHRVVSSAPHNMVVDHINHDPLDNRRANLRVCTRSENNRNTTSRKGSSSRFLGVHWKQRYRKWVAKISFDGKYKGLGSFDCEIEAAKAYDVAAMALFGPFANLNFDGSPCCHEVATVE